PYPRSAGMLRQRRSSARRQPTAGVRGRPYETLALEAQRGGGAVANEQAAPEKKGVTAEVLATVDLGPEIEGMAGRELRMRLVTMEPGGGFRPIPHTKND